MKLLGAKLAEISQKDGASGGYDQWGSPLLKSTHLECDSTTVLHSNIVNNLNRTTFADIAPLERDVAGELAGGQSRADNLYKV
jgi:hypothetical protein